ncbi:MAG: asparagine synthase (glutamine-hydrolyzing) [Acidobacteria bacterium 13_2_20CM_57_17]|nr:MAG: asparagine synthase (glutamine-hydrolyzing) [Acidobacteria bacterium 13_2_20CM_57_17]OLB94075.1 MAG: asparagine synthase (glutamine-hydrolyzing) [Acidobacteria bacterium 13_2_20CM_2_57_12]
MCGIAGIIDPAMASAEIRRTLQRMADAIWHRGPDEDGYFVRDGVGLAIRRLSIIDVAGGHQPVENEDGQVQVVLNGEIYNYLDLRSELAGRGHTFRTASDTEVIAHLYEERGADCLTPLRGMFGVAVWAQRTQSLLLGRDRLGKKPLFYTQLGSRLVFGSEIKAILAAVPELADPDPEGVVPYFRHGFISEPRTMFRGIRKLPAAHWLTYQYGTVTTGKYWHLNFQESDRASRPEGEVAEELDALLAESVRIRLMSEVPLGVFLSGGLDSSAVVAYAHKAGLRPLKTFTIGFDRPEWDESRDAQVVADHFKTDHHVLRLNEADLKAHLPETVVSLVRHFDEPFGDSSSLPTYYVSKLARQHVTVILSGDGGDELFLGYTSHQGVRFASYYQRLPSWLNRGILPAFARAGAACLPAGKKYGALRTVKVLEDSLLPFEQMYVSKGALCSEDLLKELFTREFLAQTSQVSAPLYSDDVIAAMHSDLPALNKASYIDLRHRLLEDMLVKVDRMSMAHSLEVRSPLLDHRLVEFAASLPPSLKLRGWQTKAIFRDTVRRYLPAATLKKRKHGFSVPLREWLRGGLYEMICDSLSATNGHLAPGIFNYVTISRLIAQHRKGERDHSSVLWLLLNYATWSKLYKNSSASHGWRQPSGETRVAASLN